MERRKKFDTEWLSYHMLKDDLRESHHEDLNWYFEEIEIQFLEMITEENEKDLKVFAQDYYKKYLKKLSKDENPLIAELGRFGLDLLYLQFPDL